jgi:hypothetical protein
MLLHLFSCCFFFSQHGFPSIPYILWQIVIPKKTTNVTLLKYTYMNSTFPSTKVPSFFTIVLQHYLFWNLEIIPIPQLKSSFQIF